MWHCLYAHLFLFYTPSCLCLYPYLYQWTPRLIWDLGRCEWCWNEYVNVGVSSTCLISFGNTGSSAVVGSYGSSVFRFLRSPNPIFHNSYTNLYPHSHNFFYILVSIFICCLFVKLFFCEMRSHHVCVSFPSEEWSWALFHIPVSFLCVVLVREYPYGSSVPLNWCPKLELVTAAELSTFCCGSSPNGGYWAYLPTARWIVCKYLVSLFSIV